MAAETSPSRKPAAAVTRSWRSLVVALMSNRFVPYSVHALRRYSVQIFTKDLLEQSVPLRSAPRIRSLSVCSSRMGPCTRTLRAGR